MEEELKKRLVKLSEKIYWEVMVSEVRTDLEKDSSYKVPIEEAESENL